MTNNIIVTVDLETSIKNREEYAVGTDKASPHSPKNKIVYVGMKTLKEGSDIRAGRASTTLDIDPEVDMLVGQNIKFDLLYLMRSPKTRKWMKTGVVWDTQIVEYLITGQKEKYAALGDKKNKEGEVVKQGLATKYGGTDKDDRMKEFWDNNIDTEDIPEEIVLEYLKGDVSNTELVFKCQLKIAKELGLLPLIHTQMEALLATTEMEYNGLWFDKEEAMDTLIELVRDRDLLLKTLTGYMKLFLPEEIKPNLESKDQLSAVIFGGTLKKDMVVEIKDEKGKPVRFKSGARKGEKKTRKETCLFKVKGHNQAILDTDWKTKKEGVYKVDEEVLLFLINNSDHRLLEDFCELILKYRKIEKEISTYYKPYIELCWPHDNCIHGKLNHAATGTGRLASSAPNLQNVSNKNES